MLKLAGRNAEVKFQNAERKARCLTLSVPLLQFWILTAAFLLLPSDFLPSAFRRFATFSENTHH